MPALTRTKKTAPPNALPQLLLVTCMGWAGMASAQWTVTGQPVAQLATFDDAMHTMMSNHGITAAELAVTWQGKLVLAHGYTLNPGSGDITVQPNSLMRIASNSKQITSILINRLIQEGRLSLTDKLGDFVDLTPPPGKTADPRLADITVRNLLEQLSGFGNYKASDPMFSDVPIADDLGVGLPISKADIIRAMNGVALTYQPGTTYLYSNYGYLLLGRIIEAVTGMPYERYAASVFNPIGVWDLRLARARLSDRAPGEVAYSSGISTPTVMDNSQATVPYEYGGFNIENMDSHGGWVISAVELVRIMSNLDAPAAAGAILNQASVNRMFSLPQNYPLPYHGGDPYYAEGWEVRDDLDGHRNTWHNGSLPGTTSYVVRAYFEKQSPSDTRPEGQWDYVAIFNRRDETGATDYSSEVDGLMWNAFYQIEQNGQWPGSDLFARTLPVIFRSGFD
jgi:CubicO group peptidase (beta-lactamase class C family)